MTLTTSMDPRVKLADPVRMTGRAARARPRHYGTHTLRRTKAKRSYFMAASIQEWIVLVGYQENPGR